MSIGRLLHTATDVNAVSISTDRCLLRSLNQRHILEQIHDYRALLGNPDNISMYRDGKPWNIKSVVKFIENRTAEWNQGNPFSVFSVHDIHTQAYIGTVNLYATEKDYATLGKGHHNVVEIGYVLNRVHWGQKRGTELANAACDYVVKTSQQLAHDATSARSLPTEIVATVHPDNTASVKILEHVLGEKEDCIFKKFNGQPRAFFFRTLRAPSDGQQALKNQSVITCKL